jgi:hypothetical protein
MDDPDASCAIDLTNVAVIGKLVPSGDDIIGLSGLTLVGASSALRVGPLPPDVQQVLGPVINSGLVLRLG